MTFHEQMRTTLEMVRAQLKSEEPEFFKGETMAVRAKFLCRSRADMAFWHHDDPHIEYEFTAAHDDGTPENERYSKYTPTGTLKIVVTNPAVSFTPGAYYFLDFTPVPSAEQ